MGLFTEPENTAILTLIMYLASVPLPLGKCHHVMKQGQAGVASGKVPMNLPTMRSLTGCSPVML